MDYEKKYKETLEKARQLCTYPTTKPFISDLQDLFPELKESESEKIRKALIKLVKKAGEGYENVSEGVSIENAISWLEKQVTPAKLSEEEQNRFTKGVLSSCAMSFIDYLDAHKYEGKMCVSNGECEDIENAFHNAIWDRLHRYYCKYTEKQGEQKPNFRIGDTIKEKSTCDIVTICEVDLKNREYRLSNTGFIPFKYEHLWELVEQEPAEWTEEDETTKNNINHIIRQYDKISKKENQPCWYVGDCLLWMQNIKNRVSPQPKQEWSKEDEVTLDSLVDYLLDTIKKMPAEEYAGGLGKAVVLLKSIKERVQPQPKQEWSDEDKRNFFVIEQALFRPNAYGTKKEKKDALDWLKSLRPHNTWKPSDEQMNTLEYYMHTLVCNEHKEILFGLYADLKKLREK